MARSYPKEKRDLAVRMVLDHRGEYSSLTSACLHIAPKLEIGHATLHRWVVQAEIDMGLRGGVTSEATTWRAPRSGPRPVVGRWASQACERR